MHVEPADLIPTRSSLLTRLGNWEDAASWRDFFNTYWKLIYNTARRAGLSDDEAQDVVQDTVLSVAKKMPVFKYDPSVGSFKGWLLQLTNWRILNQLKKRLPNSHSGFGELEEPPQIELTEHLLDQAGVDTTAYWEEEWHKNLVDAAIDQGKTAVSPKQYEIYYLHVVKGFPVAKVAATLNVNAAQVYLAKHRVSVLVKKEVRRLEKKMI